MVDIMIQQRLTERLVSQWKLLKDNDVCPDFSKLSRPSIADVWPNCLIVKLQSKGESSPPVYQYTEVGTKVEGIFNESPVGQYFSPTMKVMPAARIMRRMVELTVTSEPLIDDGQFVNDKSRVVKFRSCLVPFGVNGQITHVLVGLSWREF